MLLRYICTLIRYTWPRIRYTRSFAEFPKETLQSCAFRCACVRACFCAFKVHMSLNLGHMAGREGFACPASCNISGGRRGGRYSGVYEEGEELPSVMYSAVCCGFPWETREKAICVQPPVILGLWCVLPPGKGKIWAPQKSPSPAGT